MKRFLTAFLVSCFLFIFASGSVAANFFIPRIEGGWDLHGTVEILKQTYILNGIAHVTSYIDVNDNEVVKTLRKSITIRSHDGQIFDSFQTTFTKAFTIDRRKFTRNERGIRSDFEIKNNTNMMEYSCYTRDGNDYAETCIYTREEPGDSDGGCTAGANSPFAFLLALPMVFLASKKCC
ncbi:MAG: hypothetical protein GX791_05175 [Synergistaceae bacterium]|nr:hypothetical protein [Synergistaceae bacterium]